MNKSQFINEIERKIDFIIELLNNKNINNFKDLGEPEDWSFNIMQEFEIIDENCDLDHIGNINFDISINDLILLKKNLNNIIFEENELVPNVPLFKNENFILTINDFEMIGEHLDYMEVFEDDCIVSRLNHHHLINTWDPYCRSYEDSIQWRYVLTLLGFSHIFPDQVNIEEGIIRCIENNEDCLYFKTYDNFINVLKEELE